MWSEYYIHHIITWYQSEMFPYLWLLLSSVHLQTSQIFSSLLIPPITQFSCKTFKTIQLNEALSEAPAAFEASGAISHVVFLIWHELRHNALKRFRFHVRISYPTYCARRDSLCLYFLLCSHIHLLYALEQRGSTHWSPGRSNIFSQVFICISLFIHGKALCWKCYILPMLDVSVSSALSQRC